MASLKKFRPSSNYNPRILGVWVGVFAVIGVSTLLLTKAATPGIAVTVDSSIPNPTNVKVYVDDRVATISWTPVPNADPNAPTCDYDGYRRCPEPSSYNHYVIGYYVSWGTGGTYTNARQTNNNAIQIQPLVNGTAYNVKVQSIQGSKVTVPTPTAWGGETGYEYRANGKVSPGFTTTATANSTRVDQLRQQMTGFFDDFNTAAGAFDESKWNTASSTCVPPNETGSFINNQFHAHTQSRSSYGDFTYCDRGTTINRPRAIFDTTGKTEANPGVIVFDFDGVTQGRDKWYIDLIPASVRKNGIPVDMTMHASTADDDPNDPMMLRINQTSGSVSLDAFDNNKQPASIRMDKVACPDFNNNLSFMVDWCNDFGPQTAGLSPLAEMPIDHDHPGPIANVRRHWRVEVSPTKIKVYVDSTLILVGQMPSYFANVTKWYVHNNVFSYNTGKDTSANPTTNLMHWDNFGFNGPAPTTVVHNYIDGGADGQTPYVGRGTLAKQVPGGNRSLKINIPDPIGNPVSARLMFTIGSFGFGTYNWKSGDSFTVNGKTYQYQNPSTFSMLAPGMIDPPTGTHNLADGIALNPADLKQGMNDISFNFNSGDFINVHVELEYNKGSEPSYTQPTQIFTASKFLSAIQPTLASHNNYIFVEQDFGLPSGALDGGTTVPNPPSTGDTTAPTVTLTAPANNTSLAKDASVTAAADATDNTGVTKVEFYIGNTLKATDTSGPYSASLSTVGLAAGSYAVKATAYDAAGNATSSASRTIIIQSAPTTITPSPNGTTITPGTGTITDKSGATWTVTSGGIVQVNGQNAGFTASVVKVLWYNSSIYQTNVDGGWWSWSGSTWVDEPGDPRIPVDTTLPSLIVNAPTANATISGTYNVNVTASDASGIAKVEFIVDNGAVLASDTTSPYAYALDTTKLSNASHTITVRAYDTANNVRPVTVTVTVNNTVATTKCDTNNDGRVNVQDLVSLINNYSKTVSGGKAVGDCNADGKVNIQDLVTLIGQYGL